MKTLKVNLVIVYLLAISIGFISCAKKDIATGGGTTNPPPPPVVPVSSDVAFWLTKNDGSVLLTKQNLALNFSSAANPLTTITVNSTIHYQTVDGFGFALTGGSAQLINGLSASARSALLRELFSTDSTAIGISYLRVSIGASDLSSYVYTYDEIPDGQTDLNLQNFDLNVDKTQLVPLLKDIIAINPSIKILATPWTAPLWMKTNKNSVGGQLDPNYYSVYADYFVKYIQAMKAEGITIDAITPQNEPLNPGNNPSMKMEPTDEATFIKNNLGPKFKAANLATKIIIYDHNTDSLNYPLTVLNDAAAKQYVDGSAFHLYAGDITGLSTVHDAYPDKNVYFTEQYTASTGSFSGDLLWHVNNLIIGAPRNWSRNVIEWNLASDPTYGPHTNGGCSTCKGAVTISNDLITRNVSYYIISHASKFVRPGSVRIASTVVNNLQNVAYVTPDGKKVLIVLNSANTSQTFNITFNGKTVAPTLDAGAVGTFVW